MAADGFSVMARDDMQSIVDRAIKASVADNVTVVVTSSATGNTRFAANQLSTSGDISDTSVVVEAAFGPKHATVTGNDLSDDGLRQMVARAESLAKLSPDDPEAMPPLGAQQYTPVPAWFESTATLTAGDRAKAALTALQPARKATDITAAGFIVTGAQAVLTCNKAGLSAFHRSTSANYTLTVRTVDGTGSGWAAADNKDWSAIDFASVADRAVHKAQLARSPVAVEPGRYTVILEPQAVGDLVQLLAFGLNARLADEGRSPFAKTGGGNKIGEAIAAPAVTLFSDPLDPTLLSSPFDGDGYPLSRQVWIEKGVLQQLAYTRFWAKKQGKPFVGNPFGGGRFGFGGAAIKLAGGTMSTDEMIQSTDRGILVTRLWYLRQVDPRTLLFTGLTRDGTFLIEHGKVTHSVRNFRFNESPLFLLNNTEALGPAVRLAGTEIGGDCVMPTIKAHDFNFTSLSDAV
ncbi:MAG TPA: TldD/PmbA family protein [Gemmatimonadaceae bacterium]|jgi:predicted Zn-dependent protease|nr:TldD/PmbA family protein [Gemmatimonadaceae bacterium]